MVAPYGNLITCENSADNPTLLGAGSHGAPPVSTSPSYTTSSLAMSLANVRPAVCAAPYGHAPPGGAPSPPKIAGIF